MKEKGKHLQKPTTNITLNGKRLNATSLRLGIKRTETKHTPDSHLEGVCTDNPGAQSRRLPSPPPQGLREALKET